MIVLLYKGGFETATVLADAMSKRIENFRATTNIIRFIKKRKRIKPTDVLIRWGTTRDPIVDDIFEKKGALVINESCALENNTNKLQSLVLFKEAKVSCPNFWEDARKITKFPVFGRSANHKGGKDIVLIKGSNVLERNDYAKIPKKAFYTEFINAKDEYRVHVMFGKVVRVTKKVYRGHDRFQEEIEDQCTVRNDTYGWGMKAVDLDKFTVDNPELLYHSCIAVASVGLDFGAVDVIVREGDNKPFVLEVNSSPRLNSVGTEIYVNSFIEKLKGQGRLCLRES